MHPLFVTLFIDTDADDLLAEEQDRKRRACGQARQISPGQQGCRRSPGSPASPLRLGRHLKITAHFRRQMLSRAPMQGELRSWW
jgi:hypothetical protein